MLSRRQFLGWGAGAALEALLFPLEGEAQSRLVRQPYLQSPTVEGITIAWKTEGPERGAVRYGDLQGTINEVFEVQPTASHAVRLHGLKPSTPYSYQVLSPHG